MIWIWRIQLMVNQGFKFVLCYRAIPNLSLICISEIFKTAFKTRVSVQNELLNLCVSSGEFLKVVL